MFTTLVVPLDGSALAATALAPAASLARRAAASIELVTVTSPGLNTLDDELVLKDAATALGDVPYTIQVIESNDVPTAVVLAATRADSLLCMATHGRTGLARAVLGSVAEATIRAAVRPMLLVGPKAVAPASWDVVQVCVDTSSEESRRAVPVALAMARALGARLWLVEVQPARFVPSTGDVIEAGGLEALATVLERDGIDVEWEVFHGDDIAGELLRAADAVQASLLVTTTHARAGVARVALGSVTAQLAHRAPCPLLVVPPDLAFSEQSAG